MEIRDFNVSYTLVKNEDDDSGNYTVTPFEEFWYRYCTPAIFGLITLIGILGNLLVVYVIISRSNMRTVTNLLLLNLAFADLSFLCICPPFTAYVLSTSHWPFEGYLGNVFCKLMHYLLNTTVYVTIYTLVLISVIRYLTIVHNARSIAIRTKRKIIFMIIGIWALMSVLNIPIILSYSQMGTPGIDMLECKTINDRVAQKIYTTFFTFAYILPLTIIAIVSMRILHHIRKQRPTTLDGKTSKSRERKRQASRVLILVVVTFAILWLPVHVHFLVYYFHNDPMSIPPSYMAVSLLWNCLAYFNSCVNPFIYAYASKDFRDNFKEIVCCRKMQFCQTDHTVVSRIGANHHDGCSDNGKTEETVLLATLRHKSTNHPEDV